MARRLNRKQKNMIEELANKGYNSFSFLNQDVEEEIARLNWYETVYGDMERYIGDVAMGIKREKKDSIYRF
jgi:hypothetical protein